MFPYCSVNLIINKDRTHLGYSSPKEALISYLSDKHFIVDDINYKVIENSYDGIHLAYALKYDNYFNEWKFMISSEIERSVSLRHQNKEVDSPISTCIEGIRVESGTPGFSDVNFIAIANVVGRRSAQTNVARSAFEESDDKNLITFAIYKLYSNHIEGQITRFIEEGFSLSWACSEALYLINPFIASHDKSVNLELLYDQLEEIPCILLEKDSSQLMVSPKDISNLVEIKIIDSPMIRQAEYLLKEVPTERTLREMLCYLQAKMDISDKTPLICNFSNYNKLHMRMLNKKAILSIVVHKHQRRVDLVYATSNNQWYQFNSAIISHNKKNIKTLFIPKDEYIIEGLDHEIGVVAINNLYLQSSDFCKYIQKSILLFDYINNEKHSLMLDFFLTTILDSFDLVFKDGDIDKYTNEYLKRQTFYDYLADEIWNILDKKEFQQYLFNKRYYIYNPFDWTRPIGNENAKTSMANIDLFDSMDLNW